METGDGFNLKNGSIKCMHCKFEIKHNMPIDMIEWAELLKIAGKFHGDKCEKKKSG